MKLIGSDHWEQVTSNINFDCLPQGVPDGYFGGSLFLNIFKILYTYRFIVVKSNNKYSHISQ